MTKKNMCIVPYDQNNKIIKVGQKAVYKGQSCIVREVFDNGVVNIKYSYQSALGRLCPNVMAYHLLST